MAMVLPQILKRLFPGRSGPVRPDREHPPGTEEAPPRSGDETLEKAVEARKQARPNTPDR
jgi:hypothetical protein